MQWLRRSVRLTGWATAYAVGLLGIFLAQTWLWWQDEPRGGGTDTNALWARHQWVGEAHTDAEYRDLAALLERNRITDVYFHAGPFEADGTVPPAKYTNAGRLIEAMRRHAPGVRAQAYLGQIRTVDGHGIIDLDDPAVRDRVLATDRVFLDLGFDGIHYDFEPIYPDDTAFLELLDRTRELTRSRGRLLSVAIEELTLADFMQPVYRTLLPAGWNGGLHYPPRPTEDYLRAIADRSDQVAVMTYDVPLPTRSLVGRHFAFHTERTLRLIGDRTTVFMGVPTYPTKLEWAEDLPGALRGVRKGVDALARPPARPYGLGVYAEWTTDRRDWERYRAAWLTAES
ncbi:hypothetical protein [Thermomonospora umbrina]|uniref:Glycosyl hydrolase family 18 (Putative chitinase) n=1 Tax=Thermomonospora umbrina TaxID=111806 RepID=A0A3D9STD3_9ACTN|nr:hypothetical protein [Thermomonospora umbrina]REE99226.1 hypothetical protein DFJ69_4734 [Thermomonospora umbrina]